MKLELKHIAPYLSYGLEAINKDNKQMAIMGCLDKQTVVAVNNWCLKGYDLKYVKPILRPLSSMTNDEATDLFKIVFKDDYLDEDFPIVLLVWNHSSISIKTGNFNRCRRIEIDVQDGVLSIKIEYNLGECLVGGAVSYNINEWLFKHHFDVFNLIENNLAIEKTK